MQASQRFLWQTACLISHSKTLRQLVNILSLGAEVQDRSSELIPKILPLLCMLFSENKKKFQKTLGP